MDRENRGDAVDGFDGVQGMERAENQVPGFCGNQGGLDGFHVAHFSDQDHVGVLAQGAAQRPAET